MELAWLLLQETEKSYCVNLAILSVKMAYQITTKMEQTWKHNIFFGSQI